MKKRDNQLTNIHVWLRSLKDSGICSTGIDDLDTTSVTKRMLKGIGRVASLNEG